MIRFDDSIDSRARWDPDSTALLEDIMQATHTLTEFPRAEGYFRAASHMPGVLPVYQQENDSSTVQPSGPVAAALSSPSSAVEDRTYWMGDEYCKVCYDCGTAFTLLRRRHHCRLCGQVFCNSCTEGTGEARTCNRCHTTRQSIHRRSKVRELQEKLLTV